MTTMKDHNGVKGFFVLQVADRQRVIELAPELTSIIWYCSDKNLDAVKTGGMTFDDLHKIKTLWDQFDEESGRVFDDPPTLDDIATPE